MIRMVLPLCLMLMSAPRVYAFELFAQFHGDIVINPHMEPPRPRCSYSFYIGRGWIQIRDNEGVARDCQYTGSDKNKHFYACMDEKKQANGEEVEVAHNGYGWVRWVRFNSSEELTAYCD